MKSGKAFAKRNKSLVMGIACALCCAVCVALYVGQVDAMGAEAQAEMLARYGGDQVEVCVAKRDIAAGEVLADSDIEMKMWIAALLPANAVANRNEAVGQQLGSAILAGEVISSSRFGFESSDIDVPDGLTAISVPARDVQAVGGALKAGMKADVYAVGAGSATKIAAQVLILESFFSEGAASNAWVTLAVPPEKVEELVNAAENLELYFVLPSASAANATNAANANSAASAGAAAAAEVQASGAGTHGEEEEGRAALDAALSAATAGGSDAAGYSDEDRFNAGQAPSQDSSALQEER